MRLLYILIPIVLVAVQWITDSVLLNNLVLDVSKLRLLPFLETPKTYFYLHLFTFIPVFALSFDKNVHYYRKWKSLLPAIIVVGAIFIIWDIFFTAKGVWGFNEHYFLGIKLFHLPVEEWLFFFTVPFACVFIYECLNFYVKKDWFAPIEEPLTRVLIAACIFIGIWKWGHLYTSTTFLLTASFLTAVLYFGKSSLRSRFYMAYLVSFIPFLLVNGVLTGGFTNEPVVIYNPDEYFGIRLVSIPIDDAVYGFLLLFAIVALYEYFSERK